MSESTEPLYFYMAGGERRGPFTFDQLLQQPVHRQTPVWSKGMTEWMPAQGVPGLADLIPPPPPSGTPGISSVPTAVTGAADLNRYHHAINRLVPSLDLPVSPAAEKADWAAAKQKYESAGDYLRGATRDKHRFRLVYAENENYGFRRNLWGLTPGGIGIALLALARS